MSVSVTTLTTSLFKQFCSKHSKTYFKVGQRLYTGASTHKPLQEKKTKKPGRVLKIYH